jgi:hypothetical protein
MNQNNKKLVILKLDEFFSRGKKCFPFKKAMREIRNNREDFDKIRFKGDKDWSELANKIIGAE